MNIFNKLEQLVKVRKYKGELKLSPLFLETTISILAGLFMFVWGVIFFSNPLYQYSLFIKIRNLFTNEKKVEKYLDNIYCIGIDPESKLALIDEKQEYTNYDLIALGLDSISDYAKAHPDKRIVVGIDYAFVAGEARKPFLSCYKAINSMPENMFVVLGSLLIRKPETITTLRISLLEKELFDPLNEHNPAAASRLFLGNLHVSLGSIRNGFDQTDLKAAIGYTPITIWGTTIQKYFCSLPFVMYITGEVMAQDKDGEYDFYTDFGEGMSVFNDENFLQKLEKRSKKSIQQLGTEVYYNYFTGKDIADYKKNFMWLSSVSRRFNNKNSIDSYLSQPFIGGAKNGSVQYFFIAAARMPDFLLETGETNDLVLSPAGSTNAFTFENEPVLGVTSHITALSNLKNNDHVDQAPGPVLFLVLLVMAGSITLVSWFRNMSESFAFFAVIVFGFILVSYVVFCFGLFIPVTSPIAVSILIFGVVSVARFVYTTNKRELYDMVAQRVFSSKQMERLKDETAWREPKIIKNAVVMALFPRKLPDFGKTREEAERYTNIYSRFLSMVFKAIENNDGNHIVLSMDGVLGFWNIPEEQDESAMKAMNCARNCIESIPGWQSYIDGLYKKKKNRYFASFDICLHECECYAGCVGTGETFDYTVSGEGINFAIGTALSKISDKKNTLSVTKVFYKLIRKSEVGGEGDFEII